MKDVNFDISLFNDWSGDVETKWSPPEGFFLQSAKKIAEGLKANSKDKAQAMRRLNFYINRAGSNLDADDKKRLELAKTKLQKLYEFSRINKNFSILRQSELRNLGQEVICNELKNLANSNGVAIKKVTIRHANQDNKYIPTFSDIYQFWVDDKFAYGQYYKDGSWYTNTRSSNPDNKKLTDLLNKNYPEGPGGIGKNFSSNYHDKVYKLVVHDDEHSIIDLLNYIKTTAELGHSFDVVVDPDNKDYKKSFFVDGDGSDKIKSIEVSE